MAPQKDKKDHLPVLGAGPAYVITIVVLTTACIVLSQMGILPYLRIRATIAVLHTAGTIFSRWVFGFGFRLQLKKSSKTILLRIN